MSGIQKLIAKLETYPKDLNYSDLRRILNHLKYVEDTAGKTSGSRIHFLHDTQKPIILHKPHPGNVVNIATLKDVVNALKERGQI
jgi:predicted transcriptional regulator